MKKFVICLLAFLICGCRNTIDFDFDTYKQLSISVMAIFMTYVLKMTPFFQMENHTKAHYF